MQSHIRPSPSPYLRSHALSGGTRREGNERGDETQLHRKRNQQEVWLVVIEKNGSGDGVKGRGNGKRGEGERVGA